jgi:hypothetical protein
MNPDTPPLSNPSVTSDRVALRTLGERRRRVLRNVLFVVVVSLVMLVLTVANRDQQAIDGCKERMEYAVKTLREHHREWLRDPQKFALPLIEAHLGDTWRYHVLDNWRFTEQAAFAREVGVCCCERPHSPLFLAAGRHVIIYHVAEQEYELKWMTEREFARRAEELGLRVSIRP